MKTLTTLLLILTVGVVAMANDSQAPLQAGRNEVTFKSQGVNLAGLLFTPDDFDASKKYPAVVFSGDGSWHATA